MKIIKPGDKTRLQQTKRFLCEDCGCIFEANKGEYRFDNDRNIITCICTCPECNRYWCAEVSKGETK